MNSQTSIWAVAYGDKQLSHIGYELLGELGSTGGLFISKIGARGHDNEMFGMEQVNFNGVNTNYPSALGWGMIGETG